MSSLACIAPGNADLNKYCEALISMLAESVPDVQALLEEFTQNENINGEPKLPYETLVYVIEALIATLPSHSRTLEMVNNLQS